MAVVLGTNAGFVTEAPVADPEGSKRTIDTNREATKDTSPEGAGVITEVGWYCPDATEESNFEIGLYAHDAGNDKPAARLYVAAINAKGTTAGWKTVAVNWSISPATIYWLAVTVVNTATTTYIDYVASGRFSTASGQTLPDPWGASAEGVVTEAIYAVWEAGTTYSELSGTIAGVGAPSGNLEITSISELSGTIAAVATPSGNLGSVLVHIDNSVNYTRLVAIGSDQFYYEDI